MFIHTDRQGRWTWQIDFFAASPRTTIPPLLVAWIWNPDLEVVVVSRPQGGVVVKRPTHVTVESKRVIQVVEAKKTSRLVVF